MVESAILEPNKASEWASLALDGCMHQIKHLRLLNKQKLPFIHNHWYDRTNLYPSLNLIFQYNTTHLSLTSQVKNSVS